MAVLKFRVIYEDDDSVYRDIEIKPSQTFSDLESIIIFSYNLPSINSGSFFMSNDNWQKGKALYPAVISAEKKSAAKGRAKANELAALVAFIDDPHQHFIYEFYGTQEFAFLIELLTLGTTENSKTVYPSIVKSQGPSPFKKEMPASVTAKKKKPKATAIAEEDEDVIENDAEEEKSPFAMETEEQASDEDIAELADDSDVVDGALTEEKDETPVKFNVEEDEGIADVDDFDADDLGEDFNEEFDGGAAGEEDEYS